jgi:hydroxyacylglutathione hydrolase
MQIHRFIFNPFSENTYVISDTTGDCVIVDPGCYDEEEKSELSEYILRHSLKPVAIYLTHAHIDHILGNNYVTGKYSVPILMNETEVELLMAAPVYGEMWGIKTEPSPQPSGFITEGKKLQFGNTELEVLFTPGHSPGSFSFYHQPTNSLISGDVLFDGSIGRTDLPGGDFPTLEKSIREKLYVLPDDTIVYSGHGPETTIGKEKRSNPFVKA